MTFFPSETLKTFTNRLAYLQSRAWLPPALLLLALSFVFLLAGDRAYYYKDHANTSHSSKVLAIADNLSLENPFRLIIHRTLGEDGKPFYVPYSRFPIGGFALIKLTLLPFGNDLPTEIYAARMLMLLCFSAAAILAYLSLSRIAASRWIALTAVLLTFSSTYALYFSDVILNEGVIDLFAVLLVFHALVIFEQDGRFRQLLLKTCTALLLGWHVYGLLLPFIAFGLIRQLIKAWSSDSPASGAVYRLKHAARALIRSRYLTLGVVALLFGVSMLAFNFTNEYLALNREKPLTEIPSFQSLTDRIGIDSYWKDRYEHDYLSWPNFLERQFYRIGLMSLPYAFSPTYTELTELFKNILLPRPFVILGMAVFGASLIGLPFIRRHKILLASLALGGFCWAALFRYHTAFPWHNFEGLFYIGVALTLFTLILMSIRRLADERLIAVLAIAALPLFLLSALRMAHLDNPNRTNQPQLHKVAAADFENIRNMTTDGSVIWGNSILTRYHRDQRTLDYYLARRFAVYGLHSVQIPIDFVVTDARAYGLASLTPQNQMLFLYEWDDFNKHIDQVIERADEPLIRAEFDVYQDGGMLIYANDDCSEDDTANKFFLAVHPAYESDLSDDRKQYGFDDFSFHFQERALRSDERCIAIAPIPDYAIDHIHTGQYIFQADGSFKYTWEWNGRIHRLSSTAWADIDEAIAQAGEPLFRDRFDVYLNDNNLIYVKDACSEEDTNEKFFLALYPAYESDLPDERRQLGYADFSFHFHERGVRRGDRCIAITSLPEYLIDHLHTGQFIDRADGSFEYTWDWNDKIHRRISPAVWADLDEAIAQADEPLIRSDFDVYLDDNNLIYIKDACGEEDTEPRFFMALYPADENDLPDKRKQRGYDNIDFRFQEQGVQRGGRCIAIAPLPQYTLKHVHTGQYIEQSDGSYKHLWEGNFPMPR